MAHANGIFSVVLDIRFFYGEGFIGRFGISYTKNFRRIRVEGSRIKGKV